MESLLRLYWRDEIDLETGLLLANIHRWRLDNGRKEYERPRIDGLEGD